MLSNSLSFSILSLTSILLSTLVTPTSAAISQGTVNVTRDYLIHFEGYSSTESFCKAFRQECVNYNSVIGYHHQLDCVFSQKAPNVRAFCGGVKKNLLGKWIPGEAVEGFTSKMIYFVKGASIVSGPIVSGLTHTTTAASSHHKSTSVAHPHSKTTTHHSKPTSNHHHHHNPKPWGWGWPWINWHKKEALVVENNDVVATSTPTDTASPTATADCNKQGARRHRHVRNAKRAISIPE